MCEIGLLLIYFIFICNCEIEYCVIEDINQGNNKDNSAWFAIMKRIHVTSVQRDNLKILVEIVLTASSYADNRNESIKVMKVKKMISKLLKKEKDKL